MPKNAGEVFVIDISGRGLDGQGVYVCVCVCFVYVFIVRGTMQRRNREMFPKWGFHGVRHSR